MGLKVALPKGRLIGATASLLDKANWQIEGYNEKARLYRLSSGKFPNLGIKIFQEKDIPIQIAVGNYDLGICGLDWVEELLSSYPRSAIVKLLDLGYGDGSVFAASIHSEEQLLKNMEPVRLASEYPNLTQAWAVKHRLRNFRVFPLWGAAEVYPPENADIVLLPASSTDELAALGLSAFGKVVGRGATLIANRESLRAKDMSALLISIKSALDASQPQAPRPLQRPVNGLWELQGADITIALPDGHQQTHVARILQRAGIGIDDYPSSRANRRPRLDINGVNAKVIRPQDMPLQVANGYFDMAITGRDWLIERKSEFPSLPVVELADLKYGWVRIVAAVDGAIPAANISELKAFYHNFERPVRVASEYVHIADRYARSHQLGLYQLVPTWGASEAFLPDDADLLIENTETGNTLTRHNLKIIDTLFESTACVIAGTTSLADPDRRERMMNIVHLLEGGAG